MIKIFSHKNINPYTGFIYKWTNIKENKYYIGSHLGPIDDRYTGSGKYFKNAYKKCKEYFVREILEYVCADAKTLLEREQFWLSFIKKEELGVVYYNMTKTAASWANMTIEQRYKFSKNGQGKKHTEEWKRNNSKMMLGNKHAKGQVFNEERRKKCAGTGKAKTAEAEIIRKSRIAEKIKGTTCWTDGIVNLKLKPGTEAPAGYVRGLTIDAGIKIWITDGINSKKIIAGDAIPEGWRKGLTNKKKNK